MSRTKLSGKNQRVAKRTLLIYGEGLCEEIFLKHLKRLYHDRYNDVSITIKKGSGGTQTDTVIRAANQTGDFDKRFAVVDNDRGEDEMTKARNEAQNREISLIEHTPCLEAVLLSVLHDGQSFLDKDSDWCKKQFGSKWIPSEKRKEMREYERVFPKSILDRLRNKVIELDTLIVLMEKWVDNPPCQRQTRHI